MPHSKPQHLHHCVQKNIIMMEMTCTSMNTMSYLTPIITYSLSFGKCVKQ